MTKIFASLLAAHAGMFQKEIDTMDEYCDGIHFDVMDGHFVPNLTFGAGVMQWLKTKTCFDAHLMVENPDIFIGDFAKAGTSSLSIHGEQTPHVHRSLQLIKSHGMQAGIAINPATSFEFAKEAIAFADFVLVMSVNPGFGGQQFIPQSIEKIQTIKKYFPEKIIQVDGGINDKTAPLAIRAGADWLVSGSYLFTAPDLSQAVASLRISA